MAADDGVGFLPVGLLSSTALRKKPPQVFDDTEISIDTPSNDNVKVDAAGSITIINDDGSVDIDLNPGASAAPPKPSKFGDNLADIIDWAELGRISSHVMEGIQQDDMSRQEWLNDRAEGMKLLGLKVKDPRSSVDAATALDGMSSVDHPMLLEAVLTFWANASGEFLPASGPIKIDDKLGQSPESMAQAEQLEGDLNYYLTTVATEYYPDSSRALLNIGFGGMVVKKIYNCPLRQRPVSEAIDITNFIVSNAATDLRGSGRYTHVITMRPSVLKRMQLAGAYRDVPLITPSGVVPNAVTEAVADIQGVQIVSQQTEDRDHTIYECYCELDIKGFEDKRRGKPTGLPLPYRVVIDKDSQQILEIRRNWDENDETKTAKVNFVVFVLIPGFGFYGIGLLNILGNTTKAMTAAWRETLDAGMFANFPGFLFSKLMGRQNTNEFRVAPGSGVPIAHEGDDIRKGVMPLPYKDVSQAFVMFQDKIVEQGRALGGTTQIQVAEGKQDAPVGTTLAMIEQATRVEKATHKELWRAANQEYLLLKECFRENPGAFIAALKKRGATPDWSEEKFLAALSDASLVPHADPNTPSHMHRLMKAMGLIQLDKAYPGVMDPETIVKNVVGMLGFGDFDALKNKNQQAGMPPEIMAEMAKLEMEGRKLEDKGQQRMFQQGIETMRAHLAQFAAREDQRKREHEAQMALMKSQDLARSHEAEQRQHQVEQTMQQRESLDQHHDRMAQVEVSENKLAETEVASAADIEVERLREKTEDTKGSHAVNAAKAKPKPKAGAKK